MNLRSALALFLIVTLVGAETPEEFPSEFQQAAPITVADRLAIVRGALVILRQVAGNVPLQEVIHGVDPIQKLSNLERELTQLPKNETTAPYPFHQTISGIVDSLRDQHTIYVLPRPFSKFIAEIPLRFEVYYDSSKLANGEDPVRKYVCTIVANTLVSSGVRIRPGDEIIAWNGVPMDRAVLEAGQRSRGANEGASLLQGVSLTTLRFLVVDQPPESPFVTVTSLNSRGQVSSDVIDWAYFDVTDEDDQLGETGDDNNDNSNDSETSTVVGSPECTEILRQSGILATRDPRWNGKKAGLLGPGMTYLSLKRQPAAPDSFGNLSILASSSEISAGILTTTSGTFGYIKLDSFFPEDSLVYANFFIKALRKLPATGLVIDLRGNGGGSGLLADSLIQFLTDKSVQPMSFQVRATPVLQRMAAAGSLPFLNAYAKSIDIGLEWGARYSADRPATSFGLANCFQGTPYQGPVIALMDGESYSAADIFLSVFQDTKVGLVVGTSKNSGAGGASSASYTGIQKSVPVIFEPLPKGVDLVFGFERMLRSNAYAGIPVEHFGVTADIVYNRTKRDVLEGDIDLYEEMGRVLAAR